MSDFKSNVNWFPGHMAKTLKKIEGIVKLIDFWFEIVDARAPISTQAYGVFGALKNKPRVLVLNRYDLSDPFETDRWVTYFSSNYLYVLKANSKKSINLNFLNSLKLKRKGSRFFTLVAGIPNVGKSSFINSVCHSKKQKVENRAGVTRDLSWVSYKNLELCDTPGILPCKIDPLHSKYISYLGLIKSEILDLEDLTLNLICDLYGVSMEDSRLKLLEFAKSNGYVLKGNELDTKRASDAFLKKFREGKFGRISLEVVNK